MGAFSIAGRISGWIADELAQADPMDADEWGHHVTMAVMQTKQGDAIVWVILVTLRSPYLGQDPLGSTTKLQANVPQEQTVRTGVKRAVEGLRTAFDIKKREGFPQGNGHNEAGLPPGLKGMRL